MRRGKLLLWGGILLALLCAACAPAEGDTVENDYQLYFREEDLTASSGGDVFRTESIQLPEGLDAQAAAGLYAQLAAGRPAQEAQQFAQETVFLQGVLDLAFWEDDGWVLVDYKSGSNRGKSAEQVREQYGLQLAIYRWALAKASRQPVKEGYIYFTANGRNVRLF